MRNNTFIAEANAFHNDYEKLLKFIEKNNSEPIGLDHLLNIRNQYEESEYQEIRNKSHILSGILMLMEEDEIKDYAFFHGERDLKTVKLEFPTMTNDYNERPLVDYTLDYITLHYNMITVHVLQNKEDKSLGRLLEKKEMESLGEEFGKVVYFMEKQPKEERERIICTM